MRAVGDRAKVQRGGVLGIGHLGVFASGFGGKMMPMGEFCIENGEEMGCLWLKLSELEQFVIFNMKNGNFEKKSKIGVIGGV
jgi:hypothetical protein